MSGTAIHGADISYPATELPTVALAGRSRGTRWLGRGLLIVLVLAPFVLAFAPWQQNLAGEGRVIEFDPVNRPMPVQARTDGIVLQWHVREGQWVELGNPIVDLADNDPRILERLQEQLTAAEQKRAAAVAKREQYALQVLEAEAAKAAAIQVADDDVAVAQQNVVVAAKAVEAAERTLELNEFQEQMFSGLIEDRIAPRFELQRARQAAAVSRAELESRRASLTAAEALLRARISARQRVERDEQVKVYTALANRDNADGEIAEAEGGILRLQRDLERQKQQQLVAPTAGYVQNLFANGQGGAFVKQGTTLAMLVPKTKTLAVELLVDGNDVTFIEEGRHVRLQFEGWPAIQWVGWPSAAVGTFGGRVAFVDRFDNGQGQFRVMVLPDERPFGKPEGPVVHWLRRLLTFGAVSQAENPHAWPDDTWLRQGVRAKGWIVLDRVSLGFEVWRQLNGFPPTIQKPTGGKSGGVGDEGGK